MTKSFTELQALYIAGLDDMNVDDAEQFLAMLKADAGGRIGITQQAVGIALDAAITKIQRIYDEWEDVL